MDEEKNIELELLRSLKNYLLYENKLIQDLGVFISMSGSIFVNNLDKSRTLIGILPALSLLELVVTGLKVKTSERIYEYTRREYDSYKRTLEKRRNNEH
jgi:hypothetical protein